jgi:hypothetical protein
MYHEQINAQLTALKQTILQLLYDYVEQNGGKIKLQFNRLTGEDDETCVVELENEGGMVYFIDDNSEASLISKHLGLQLWSDILGDIELGYYSNDDDDDE